MHQQLDLHETDGGCHQFGGFLQREHAHRTCDFLEQPGNLLDASVIPGRLDEGDHVALRLLEVDRGLAHEHVQDAANLGLGQFELVVPR